jgi:hypothetical protein
LNTLDYWADLALNAKAEVMRLDFPADPTDPIPVTPVTDFVFYVWEPNFEKLWPAHRAVEDKTDKTDMSDLSC